jgi:hypothetical protein
VLRDAIAPKPIADLCITLDEQPECAKVFWLMDENPGELEISGNILKLPAFTHGCVIRVKNKII